MKKASILVLVIVGGLVARDAYAHVVVRPDAVGIGKFQTFSVSVPSEKEEATVEVRLLVPDGLEHLTPTVKPGWRIEVLKHELPSGDHPYEISWRGGEIPGYFRDEFTFSAKVPAEPATLAWKAYQKYSDGSVVSWDLDPAGEQPQKPDGTPDFSTVGPLSQTQIVDDLSGAPALVSPTVPVAVSDGIALPLSVAAIVISLAAAGVALMKRGGGPT